MQARPAIGIDLGTSNTAVAVVQGNKVTVIPDRAGKRVHPSVICFHPNGTVLSGSDAKARRSIDAANTVFSSKRLIGRRFTSQAVQEMMQRVPYKIIQGDNEQPLIESRKRQYTCSEIGALVLRAARDLAQDSMDQKVEDAVVTVPANFDDAQREATRLAGRIAGLNVLRVLNEPTAAALAYGYGRGIRSRIAIYDFGGGTFDITILQLDDQVFEVLATAGDTFLGGDDIDEVIVTNMVQMFLRETRIDLALQRGAMERLRSVAEQIKCSLTTEKQTLAQVQEVAYGEGGQPLDLNVTLTSEALDTVSRPLVQRSLKICDEALKLADLSATQIDDVVMVGGTTRMPLVRQMVEEYFGVAPRTDINPDEVVAVGAAIQAATLLDSGAEAAGAVGGAAARPSSVLLDVTPRALGIAVVGGFAETIVSRNAPIPMEQTRRFSTSRDQQTSVRIQVCQGESNVFEENQPLGELVLESLRPALRGQVKVEVTFEVDTDGILQVSAVDLDTGQAQQAHVRLLGTISEDQAEAMAQRPDQLPMAAASDTPSDTP